MLGGGEEGKEDWEIHGPNCPKSSGSPSLCMLRHLPAAVDRVLKYSQAATVTIPGNYYLLVWKVWPAASDWLTSEAGRLAGPDSL